MAQPLTPPFPVATADDYQRYFSRETVNLAPFQLYQPFDYYTPDVGLELHEWVLKPNAHDEVTFVRLYEYNPYAYYRPRSPEMPETTKSPMGEELGYFSMPHPPLWPLCRSSTRPVRFRTSASD